MKKVVPIYILIQIIFALLEKYKFLHFIENTKLSVKVFKSNVKYYGIQIFYQTEINNK